MSNLVERVAGYKLNAGALDDLEGSGLPKPVTSALRALQDRHFASKAQFVLALRGLEPAIPLAPHQQQIVATARVLRAKRIGRFLRSYWDTFVARTHFVPDLYTYLLLRPLVMSLRLRLRWWYFAFVARLTGRPPILQMANSNAQGFTHNRRQVLSFLEGHRNRTESLMNVLRTIRGVDFSRSRLLCVGPRNEAEVLLLRLYGFACRNVEAIDLFTYSPRIRVMDMNNLDYPDNHFDVYYSSAVIKYSPDIRRSVAESIRVTRSGGLMVYGFMFGEPTDLIPTGSELSGGVADLLALYGGHVEHVFWHEEFRHSPGDTRAAVIFRLRKS